nr:putative ORF1 [Marmot picobirnavirus]
MTNNQIQYQRSLEEQRANRAREYLTSVDLSERERHNRAGESYSWADLGERTRHNKASESFSWSDLAERSRHNQATESLGWAEFNDASKYRWADLSHRSTKDLLDYRVRRDTLNESHRSNIANEIEKYLDHYNGLGVALHPQFYEYGSEWGNSVLQMAQDGQRGAQSLLNNYMDNRDWWRDYLVEAREQAANTWSPWPDQMAEQAVFDVFEWLDDWLSEQYYNSRPNTRGGGGGFSNGK